MCDSCACGTLRQLTWSPLFRVWLCAGCLWQQTEALLREPVTALPAETAPPQYTLASGGYISPGTTVRTAGYDTCYFAASSGVDTGAGGRDVTRNPLDCSM